MDKRPAASVVDYLYSLELPDMGPQFEEVARRPAFSSDQQAVTVGAQITEFTSRVPSDIRQAIADGILLAQLAANRHSKDSGADVFGWYDKYVEVLQNIGWQFRDIEFQTQSVSQASGDMHKALIPVVTAMLGPQVAAASIVLSVLGRLEEMDKDKPWITAFERASQHASGAKFQVGYVDAGAEGQPEATLACFGIEAQRTVTQVLFFKFSGDQAVLKKAASKMELNMLRLNNAREIIAGRVDPYINEYVSNIAI
jgi:hypothetical protein